MGTVDHPYRTGRRGWDRVDLGRLEDIKAPP